MRPLPLIAPISKIEEPYHTGKMVGREVEAGADGVGTLTCSLVLTCIMSGSGGIIYGYDLVIAGGISIMDDFLLKFYPSVYMHKKNAKEDNYCKYNSQLLQLYTSSMYLAALLATLVASLVSTKLGRRATMRCAGMFFIVGTVLGTSAQNLGMLISGRAVLGCGLGFAFQAVPMYLSEIAPPRLRGGFASLFAIYITIGIFTGNMVNYMAAKLHPWGWRLSLGIAGIPALLLTFCSLIIVESPYSLIERGHHDDAREVLRKIRGSSVDVSKEYDELLEAYKSGRTEDSSYKELFCERRHRAEVVLACVMAFFQQVAGNDAILFYGTFLFKLAGFGDQASLYSVVIIGACNVLFACIATALIDNVGRRKLLFSGCFFMLSSLVVIGSIFQAKLQGSVRKLPVREGATVVAMLCLFVLGFGLSLGPLAWLIPSEILSPSVRSAGLSVNVFVNVLFKAIIAQTFLSMLCTFKYGIFFFFAGWVMVAATFTVFFLPETKHVPLYRMETLWQTHWFWRHIVPPPPSSSSSSLLPYLVV